MIVIAFLILAAIIGGAFLILYLEKKNSNITVGCKVRLKNNAFNNHIYTVLDIDTFGTCYLLRVDKNHRRQEQIGNLLLVKEKPEPAVKEEPVVKEKTDAKEKPVSRVHLKMPFAVCPNCGGRFNVEVIEKDDGETFRCEYCDSVFSKVK